MRSPLWLCTMTTTKKRMRNRPLFASRGARWSLGLAIASMAILPIVTPLQTASAQESAPASKDANLDTLVLRNGRIIKGTITKETESEVQIIVVVAGITAPASFLRSEILEIHHSEHDPAAGDPDAPNSPQTPREPAVVSRKKSQPRTGSANDKPVIYVLPLKGHIMGQPLGLEFVVQEGVREDIISITPVSRAIEDARTHNPDVIVIEIDADSPGGFDGLFVAQPIIGAIEKLQESDVRVVFWVKRAIAGAAFLPFISPEIYFKSDGVMGGVGNLGSFNIGDDIVNEKQISLRLGIAEGYAIQGGYDSALVRAMARKENWLFVRWEDGKPVYLDHEPRPSDGSGWSLLSDDGAGENADVSVLSQNDVLQLDADWSQRLRVSKGAADSLDDLAFMLGYGRGYRVERGNAKRILTDWGHRVAAAVDEIVQQQELIGGRRGRRSASSNTQADIGRKIGVIRRIRGLLTVYAEVLDPDGSRRAQFDLQVEELRQSLRDANKQNDRSERRGGR